MSIEVLTSQSVYIDYYSEQTITISSSKNNFGMLMHDDNNNSLGGVIHFGSKYITSLTSTIPSNIIIYDDVSFRYIDETSIDDEQIFNIKPGFPVSYKIGASEEEPVVSGNTLTLDLSAKQVFKILINGEVIPSSDYSYTSSGITITGNSTELITGVNDSIYVYTYTSNQLVSGSATLTYNAGDVLRYTRDQLEDLTAFSDMRKISRFDNISTSKDRNVSDTRSLFTYVQSKKQVDRTSKATITMFEDIRNEIKGKFFRILLWNDVSKILVILNNLYFNDGDNNTYNKQRNEITYSFDMEDELVIDYSINTLYGEGGYGEGYYGGILQYNADI